MSGQYVTDTHPLIWHLTNNPRMPDRPKSIFKEADKGWVLIEIPGIVLVEMVYLTEKQILLREHLSSVIETLSIPDASYRIAPLDQTTAIAMLDNIPWSAIPELADRIISATARARNLPLITKDQRIVDSGLVETIW